MYFKKNIFNLKFLFFLGVVFLVIDTVMGVTHVGVWADELFSIKMVSLPLEDMINLGIQDVHPLLYYFIYKLFVNIFLVLGYNNIPLIGVFVSLIPMYILCIVNYFITSKEFGFREASLFNFLIFSMPLLMSYSVEIRMYTWALLFITLQFIFIKKIINESNIFNWTIFTIMAILSAYTHYFAAIASFTLYLTFLIYVLLKNRLLLKKLLLSAIVTIFVYIPWLPSLLYQVSQVRSDFWLPDLTVVSIFDSILFVFSPYYNPNLNLNIILSQPIAIICAIILICSIFIVLIKNNWKMDNSLVLIGLISFLLIPTIGIGFSLFDTAIYHRRYIFPALGIFWLCFSILFFKLDNKKIMRVIIVTLLIIASINAIGFIYSQELGYEHTLIKYESLNNVITDKDIVITQDNVTFIELNGYYLSDSYHFKYNHDLIVNLDSLFNNSTISNLLNNGSNVYFVDNNNNDSELLQSYGFNVTNTGINEFDGDIRSYTIYEISKSF